MILRRCALCDEPCLPGLTICDWHRNEGAGQPRTPVTTPGSEGGTGADSLCEDCGATYAEHTGGMGPQGPACPWNACKGFVPVGPKS